MEIFYLMSEIQKITCLFDFNKEDILREFFLEIVCLQKRYVQYFE